jgi:hypothetical protein
MAACPCYIASAQNTQKTLLPTAPLLLYACLLQPSHDGYWAIAWQQACLQSHSLTTAVSAGFTILAFSRHATCILRTLLQLKDGISGWRASKYICHITFFIHSPYFSSTFNTLSQWVNHLDLQALFPLKSHLMDVKSHSFSSILHFLIYFILYFSSVFKTINRLGKPACLCHPLCHLI